MRTPPPTNKGKKFPPEPLTKAEIDRMLAVPSLRAPTGVRNRALIHVMFTSGLRIGELLAVKPSNVNLDTGEIRVLHGKGDKARAAGTIGEKVMVDVVRWLEVRRAHGISARALLFCTLEGTEMSQRYVRQMLNRVADKAGVDKRVHPHGMRHSHAAELVAQNVSPVVIQQQLGHRSLSTTTTYLSHVSPAARIAQLRNLED